MSSMNVEFGPDHETHRRVLWPEDLQNVTIQLPWSFLRHLSCNSALSATEISEVNEFQMETQDKERELNLKIRQLQDDLARAQHELKQVSKQSFACKTSLSPFRTLPDDILYQIVRQISVYESPSSTTHIPSILCQVSTSWRDVTYGMPGVWQLIRLSNQQTELGLQGRLEHFARLSNSLPLIVEMHNSTTFVRSSNAELASWLLSKWEGRNRLRVLIISTASPLSVFQGILSSSTLNEGIRLGTSIPLQTLRIEVNTGRTVHHEDLVKMEDVAELLDRFPSIHSLWVDQHPRSMQDFLPLSIQGAQSLSNLTKLSLVEQFLASDSLDPNQHHFRLRSILKLFPMLEVAYLSICTDPLYEEPYAAPSEIVTHENLKELALNFSLRAPGITTDMILSGFYFSAVTALRLEWDDAAQYLDESPLDTSGIFPSLQTLVISRNYWCSWSLSRVLHPLSAVTDLTILYSGSLHFEGIQSLGVVNRLEDINGVSLPQHEVYLPPKLTKLQLQFLSHWNWLTAGEMFEHCMTELRSSLSPSISISLVLVVREVNTIKVAKLINSARKLNSVASRRAMLQYFLSLRSKFKESLDIDVDILENDGPFPLDPLRDHFIQYFN